MGLYLTIFSGDEEIDGLEVGSYADFDAFRSAVVSEVEGGKAGSRCPTLVLHPDCDGEWSPEEAAKLQEEIEFISARFKALPPVSLAGGWKEAVALQLGLKPTTLYDCFFDVDGEPLLERLRSLAITCQQRNLPILFQ